MERITFACEGNASPICLNESIFTKIIRDPASPPEELCIRCIRFITFPNNVLVSKFHDECG